MLEQQEYTLKKYAFCLWVLLIAPAVTQRISCCSYDSRPMGHIPLSLIAIIFLTRVPKMIVIDLKLFKDRPVSIKRMCMWYNI